MKMEEGKKISEKLPATSFQVLADLLKTDNRDDAINEFIEMDSQGRQDILSLAFRHKILWHLKNSLSNEIDSLPEDITGSLSEACRHETLKNLKFVAEMISIQKEAKSSGLDFMFYKGAVLAAHLYSHVGARKFEDLDIICPTLDTAKQLRKLLIKMGYTLVDKHNDAQEKQYCKYHCEFMLFHPQKKILTEIHWRFFPGYFAVEPSLEQLFKRAQSVEVAGNSFLTLSDEDLIITIAAHSTKHIWNDWRQILDFANLIQRRNIDWLLVKKVAESSNCLRMVRSGIHLVKIAGLLSQDFVVSEGLMPEETEIRAARKILKRHLSTLPSAHNISEEIIYLLRMQDSWANRIKFALGAVFSPSKNDFDFVSFGEKFSWLYYLVRPFRQICKICKGR